MTLDKSSDASRNSAFTEEAYTRTATILARTQR